MDKAVGCSYCGKRSPDLLRCGKCKGVYYCSKECQRGHWREGHREHCKMAGSQDVNAAESCTFCGQRSPDLLRCSRCKEVRYCSKDCQRGHWKAGHRGQCVAVVSQVCRFCNKASKQLKRCVSCLQVSYCSKECQREDWRRRHRDECKAMSLVEKNETRQKTKPEAEEEREEIELYKRNSRTEANDGAETNEIHDNDSLPICAHCRAKSTNRACKNCNSVFYCSKSCQKLHWKKHKTSCKARTKVKETLSVEQCTSLGLLTPEENEGLDPNDVHAHESNRGIGKSTEILCCRCKSKFSTLTCPVCNSVTYCSMTCLNQDKDDHKEICKNFQEHRCFQSPSHYPESLTLGVDTSDKKDLWTVSHSPSHSTVVFPQDPLSVQDYADLTLVVERSVATCERAREIIKRKFPSNILITRVREIPMEEISVFGANICTQPFVFLSYIRRFHGYRGRHNVYLQDSERREIYVSFYLPNDDPSPHFRWNDVVPGKFIAILFPCIHAFLDGSFGLRVDKATNAFIFDLKD